MYPIYNIKFSKLVVDVLPIVLRRPLIVALFRAVTVPLAGLNGWFVYFVMGVERSLAINGQVVSLQRELNALFDASSRRITISDANTLMRLHIYTRKENEQLDLFTRSEEKPIYLNTRADFADSGYDFYVNLNGVVLTARQRVDMQVFLNQYKLVTKKYMVR